MRTHLSSVSSMQAIAAFRSSTVASEEGFHQVLLDILEIGPEKKSTQFVR
jgi:hypothetical protein